MKLQNSQRVAMLAFLVLAFGSATALSGSCPLWQYDTEVATLEIESATRDGQAVSIADYPDTIWLESFRGEGCDWLAEASKLKGDWQRIEFDRLCFSYGVAK